MEAASNERVKRAIDAIGSVTGLIVLAPLLFLCAALIWMTMGTPILFRQPRPGLGGRIFQLYKFRTMTEDKNTGGLSAGDEARLTRLGRVLRQTSIDELPELWNVARGDMSLVGPRPLLVEYLPLYDEHQFRRHEVRPGLTGLAQVSGRNNLSWEDRFTLDVWYVDHRSLRLDLSILARTLAKVFRMEGISGAGHATMEPFRGRAPQEKTRDQRLPNDHGIQYPEAKYVRKKLAE